MSEKSKISNPTTIASLLYCARKGKKNSNQYFRCNNRLLKIEPNASSKQVHIEYQTDDPGSFIMANYSTIGIKNQKNTAPAYLDGSIATCSIDIKTNKYTETIFTEPLELDLIVEDQPFVIQQTIQALEKISQQRVGKEPASFPWWDNLYFDLIAHILDLPNMHNHPSIQVWDAFVGFDPKQTANTQIYKSHSPAKIMKSSTDLILLIQALKEYISPQPMMNPIEWEHPT